MDDLIANDKAKLFTVKEVANIFRVSSMTIFRLVHSGELGSVRVGRGIRIPRQALERFIDENLKTGAVA